MLFRRRAACQTCHPASYADDIDKWKGDISAALRQAKKALENTQRSLSVKESDDPKIRRAMDNIRHNILFVENSTAIHNRDYAILILEKAARDLSGITKNTTQR